ncbi:MAG: carotenoid 1,2-hydratase [Pseudomonadota bacterium]
MTALSGGAHDAKETAALRQPRFDVHVPSKGYHWWYVDAISDDGTYGVTVIAFIGSVFSPYYAWRGRNDPEDHVAVNVAIYGKGVKRWTMTERGKGALTRDHDYIEIGPSAVEWNGEMLTVRFDEVGMPVPLRAKGQITLRPRFMNQQDFSLDQKGLHKWWPIAPVCDAEVELERPGLSWRGHGYLDNNWGDEPLEAGFHRWDWSRAPMPDDGAAILYDLTRLDGDNHQIAIRFDKDGGLSHFDAPPQQRLSNTLYRVPRYTQCEDGFDARVVETFEDTHFYQRAHIHSKLCGHVGPAMHESMALYRFRTGWAKMLLPFRMPRRG